MNWKEVRQYVLKRDGRCQSCGTTEDLVVHHISGPSDDPSNLVTLCKRCHDSKVTSGGRWIRKKVGGSMKTERIYRELLLSSLSDVSRVKQEELANRCQVSLGLANKTVKKLEEARAVEATRRGVRVLSPARILNLWAAERRLNRDIVSAFRLDPLEEEWKLPRTATLTAFSAWCTIAGRRPAEYSRLYFYIWDLEEFERWFEFRRAKARKTNPNMFVLQVDDPHLFLTSKNGIAPIPQIYVDIYSIGGPEAAPYLMDIVQTYPELSPW